MNDNMQDNWGYGDNFTNPQIQVPFAIVGSKINKDKLQNKASSLTTHYDLVPTLMQNFLGVGNNIEDYSIGFDLFAKKEPKDWMLVASTSLHYRLFSAIITEKQSCYWLPTGKYWLTDKQNKQLIANKVNTNYLNQALEYMTRFIKK